MKRNTDSTSISSNSTKEIYREKIMKVKEEML